MVPRESKELPSYLAERLNALQVSFEEVRAAVVDGPIRGAVASFDLFMPGVLAAPQHAHVLVVPEIEVLSVSGTCTGGTVDAGVFWDDGTGITSLFTGGNLSVSTAAAFLTAANYGYIDKYHDTGTPPAARLQNTQIPPLSVIQATTGTILSGTPEDLHIQILARVLSQPRD